MIASGSQLKVKILGERAEDLESFQALVVRFYLKNGDAHLDIIKNPGTVSTGKKNGSMPGDKVIGVCQVCGLTVVQREDGTRAHIGWTRPEETWHDSYTAEDQQREFEHFLAKQEEAERKAIEVKERQARARALPSDGVCHSMTIRSPIVLSTRAENWWRRLFR